MGALNRKSAIGAAVATVAFWVTFFWPGQIYREARLLERLHCRGLAAASFARFADRRSGDPKAAEALVRAADLQGKALGRWGLARALYERAARGYLSNEEWAVRARRSLLDCPDYFPLRDGMKWTYGDAQTGGRNMRLEIEMSMPAGDGYRGQARGFYFAGRRRFQEYRRGYQKEDWSVWEERSSGRAQGVRPLARSLADMPAGGRTRILQYPFIAGMSWSGERDGQPVGFEIISATETVAVRAGRFGDCLKVREFKPGSSSWKYDYYAPGIGRIKTTVGGADFENPNTELLSVSVGPTP